MFCANFQAYKMVRDEYRKLGNVQVFFVNTKLLPCHRTPTRFVCAFDENVIGDRIKY